MAKREVDLVILSDVHLGTFGCHAKELLAYLKSIKPKTLVLNGDIIDIWQFSKSYWPDAHTKVIRRVMKLVTEGVNVHYLTGNHDEMLRKFADLDMGNFHLSNKLILDVGKSKAWIFHGDIFDVTMQHSKWLAKLGAVGYDTLILINSFVNWTLTMFGKEKMSFSKRVKERFKDAVRFINQFELTAAELAIEKGYDYVICGHIHQPEMRVVATERGAVQYLNSGDWVENLTALEYHDEQWKIYRYTAADFKPEHETEVDAADDNLDAMLDVNKILEKFRAEV